MKWRGFRHPSPDPTDLRLHKPVRDCWTDWIPRTGASDAELANALRRIEGTRNAIGASPVIAQQYADECSAFLHLHHEALIRRLASAGSAPAPSAVPKAVLIGSNSFTGGVARPGDWAIPTGQGVVRIVDERMAYGWNECRKAVLETAAAPTQEPQG